MGTITEKKRRYYSGLNADKVSIPAAGKVVGDRYYATDTLVEFTWTGAAWVPLGDDVVDAGMLQTDAVETLKIKNLNVTVGKLAGGITAGKLATDCVETLKIKDLNVTKAKAEIGFGRYVPRDTNVFDKQATDFTIDGNWHVDGLDLSGVIPEGAVGVVMKVTARATAANIEGAVRRSAGSGYNGLIITTQVANVKMSELNSPFPCDADRLFDYRIFANMDMFYLTVTGWFI